MTRAIPRPAWMAPAPAPDVDALPPATPGGRTAANILSAEILSELRAMHATTTEYQGRLAGLVVNEVLDVQSRIIPATDNHISRQYHVPCGVLVVDNQGQNTMWVAPGGYSGAASGQPGGQSTPVPPGAQRIVNLASRQWTITGTAGDLVAWQAFTRGGVIPGSGLGAVNGGGA